MAFWINLGYQFKLPTSEVPDGSIILCSAMPMHELQRRRIDDRYPHLQNRLFDPQLYMAGLDASETRRHCSIFASYPWFGVRGLQEYESDLHDRSSWRTYASEKIVDVWPGNPPADSKIIDQVVKECIDFQIRLGCQSLILPSPLSADPGSDYSLELLWLDKSINYVRNNDIDTPILATVALADICVRYIDPPGNQFLDLVLDAISAREVDGVYIVFEQGSEKNDTRYCGNSRSLRSALHLTHIFAQDCGLMVATNFFGPFGLALAAAGARIWASGWYKSLIRLRLADKLASGRAYPLYWSYPAALDIHLDSDFDTLNRGGILRFIADQTAASEGLLQAAARGVRVVNVPAWRYRLSNVSTAREHYYLSAIRSDSLQSSDGVDRVDLVEHWLREATNITKNISSVLGKSSQTKTDHVQAWLDAFLAYRRDHNV